jgi:hypothetical protein
LFLEAALLKFSIDGNDVGLSTFPRTGKLVFSRLKTGFGARFVFRLKLLNILTKTHLNDIDFPKSLLSGNKIDIELSIRQYVFIRLVYKWFFYLYSVTISASEDIKLPD